MSKGWFITLEGGDGAGKSTLMAELKKSLIQRGFEVVTTREPGGSSLGEAIRQLLLSHNASMPMGAKAELLLFLAARAQHIEELIMPALRAGKIVLCDRFNDSTVAYQSGARGLDLDFVDGLCKIVCGKCQPDLTLYLDIDPEIGRRRAEVRSGDKGDRIEVEEITFHHRVRKAFLEIAEREPERVRVIDAAREKGDVFRSALDCINQLK